MAFTDEAMEFIEEMREAVQKQRPLQPIKTGACTYCPVCRMFIGKENQNYCDECGQKLDWKVIRTG